MFIAQGGLVSPINVMSKLDQHSLEYKHTSEAYMQ